LPTFSNGKAPTIHATRSSLHKPVSHKCLIRHVKIRTAAVYNSKWRADPH